MHVTLPGSTDLDPMDHIEFALFSQACRLQGHTLRNTPSVRPDLDCMAEAISTTCNLHGMNDEETAAFLLQAATIVHELGPEIRRRKHLRRMEQRLLQLVGPPLEPNSEELM